MATALKLRRGTTTQHNSFTGAEGEVTVDTTKDTVVVHDGSTAGGFPMARDSAVLHNTGAESAAGLKTFSDGIAADTIAEKTAAAGVTIDSVLLKDGGVGIGADGSASAPSVYRASDTNTGVFFPAADTVGVATGGSERMRVDSSGNVGIGTTSPSSLGKLSVDGNFVFGPFTQNQADTRSIGIFTSGDPASNDRAAIGFTTTAGTSSSNSYITFSTNNYGVSGGERARITSDGNFAIGTTSASAVRLIVKGSSSNGTSNCIKLIDSADADVLAMSTGGDFYLPKMGSSTGTTVVLTSGNYLVKSSSSIRYKKDVEPIDIGLNFVLGLNPVKYKMKADDADQVGFIAEEFPDERLVSFSMIDPQDKDSELQRESVNYANLVAPLVKAIQELKAINDAQATRIETLEAQNAAFEARLAALESK